MGRNRQRKTNKGNFSEEQMRNAISQVKSEGKTLREAAAAHGISYATLHRYVKKFELDPTVKLKPKYDTRRVIPDHIEELLVTYLQQSADRAYGTTPKECRKLAHQIALKNAISVSRNWKEQEMAGLDWIGYITS